MAYWITLGRSFFAIALGIAILFYPQGAGRLLGNFIGGFWLAGSLLTLRWGFAHEQSRALTVIVGLLGAVAGLLMAGRLYAIRVVPEEVLWNVLGVVAILTGLLHATGHMQIKKFTQQSRTRSGLLLGVFEIVLGCILLLNEWQERPIVYYVAAGWALVGGIVILLDALAMRRESKEKERDAQ